MIVLGLSATAFKDPATLLLFSEERTRYPELRLKTEVPLPQMGIQQTESPRTSEIALYRDLSYLVPAPAISGFVLQFSRHRRVQGYSSTVSI